MNCMNMPIRHKQINNLFRRRLINCVDENWNLESKGFSLEIKKSIEENIADAILNKKQAFMLIKSEI